MLRWRLGMVLWLLVACGELQAGARAWLDRDRIAFGETATLNIESDRAGVDAPDYGVLSRDFQLSGHTSRRSTELVNGRRVSRSLFAVALQPRREGVIGIPAVEVGGERTQPLTLMVSPSARSPARAGEVVFLETEVDDHRPYVQQAVGILVRLYYAVPLVSGELDQPAPDGASLQRVGDDVQYTRSAGGRRYTVLERRYLLVPERSGDLTLPGARFEGRGAGGFFDDLFNGGRGDALRAAAAQEILEVQPIPANAPQPWLPLHALRLRYLTTPQAMRAGEAATVVVEAVADGATAAQMPELQLPVGDGAQVFAEPPQADERFRDGRPQVTVTRRFAVVPARAGALRIDGPRLPWWDVGADQANVASLPALDVQVDPGDTVAGSAAASAPAGPGPLSGDAAPGRMRLPGVQGDIQPWAVATVAFAVLWLLTLGWALRRREAIQAVEGPRVRGAGQAPAGPQRSSAGLRRALQAGDLGEVEDALKALAPTPAATLDAVREQLQEPGQRQAVEALQQARWGAGDPVQARNRLREAFAQGPRWRGPDQPEREVLPPLYPD